MDSEVIAMEIIASAGDSKALAFEALEAAQNYDFEKAKTLLRESEKASLGAHKAQTELLVQEANGNKTDINVLLIHSQDHLMMGILAHELISEMVKMYQKMSSFEENIKERI
ncbi:MAG: PTS lactose/cellobiose transporter subunit IIA [Erysipelotrichaceae bacterium]|nr:PTS lactose/cellobiose transporter subunit IIA [Erysipelotrichaceae bacterium]